MLAKADSMTTAELREFRAHVRAQLEHVRARWYQSKSVRIATELTSDYLLRQAAFWMPLTIGLAAAVQCAQHITPWPS